MSFLNKVFREILKIKPFFQSLGRFRLGVGVSFSADTPVTGSVFLLFGGRRYGDILYPKQGLRSFRLYSCCSLF